MEIQKNNKNQSLHQAMQEHYIDADGKTIVEAVALGMLFLELMSGMHESKVILAKAESRNAVRFDDFFMSLVSENMDDAAFKENRHLVNAQIEVLSGVNREAAEHVRTLVYGTFLDLLNNKFFIFPGVNILLRTLIAESVMRFVNAYIFSGLADKDKEMSKVAYANFQCQNHPLSMIAFLCNQKLLNYFQMNIKVEKYTHEISKVLLS